MISGWGLGFGVWATLGSGLPRADVETDIGANLKSFPSILKKSAGREWTAPSTKNDRF